jgi:hypothetical protein
LFWALAAVASARFGRRERVNPEGESPRRDTFSASLNFICRDQTPQRENLNKNNRVLFSDIA